MTSKLTPRHSDSKAFFRYAGLASILTLLAAPSVSALAQEDGPPASKNRKGALSEITVTARRQEENLQNTPLSVSAFNADSLHQGQVENIGDLQSYVPNLSLHVGDAANAVIYIRGVGQIDSISFNDPGVGVYVDDVYMGRAQGSFLEVLDPASIEVLRGPQGTLYGRNTIGGAVKFISARPTNDFEGYVDTTLGNFHRREIKVSLSGPIIKDTLLGKGAVVFSRRDGYTRNTFDGQDDFDKDLAAWRGSLLYTPNDDLSFYLVTDGSDSHPSHSRSPHKETPIFSVVSGMFVPPTSNPFVVDVNFNTLDRLKTWGVALTSEYSRNKFSLKSITSYRKMDYRTKIDLDGTRDSSFGIYDFEDQDQFSEELQFSYTGERFSLVSGLYYFRETDATFGGAVAPDFFVTLPVIGVFPFPIINAGLRDQTNTSKAVYAQADYNITPDLRVTFGARFTQEKKKVNSAGEEFFGTGITTPEGMEAVFGTGVGLMRTSFNAKDKWNSFSPKFSVDYQVTDDVMVYASASRGFKSGGFNGRLTDRAQPFDPETMWSYEGGFKAMFADERVRLNMAGFYNDYKNFQLSRFTSDPMTGAFVSVFDNAGSATIYGVEGEATALVTDSFQITGNFGYLHSKYDNLLGDFDIDVSSSRHLVNAPRWTGRVGFTYDYDLAGLGSVTLGSAVSYRSKTYLTVSSSEILAQNEFALVEASLSYVSPDEHWNIIVSGQNLTDKKYREHGFDLSAAPGVQLGYYGTPRTYSVNLRYMF